MAIDMLRGIESIGDFKVAQVEGLEQSQGEEFVVVDHGRQSICFTLQNGPPQEAGINGCRVETMLEVVRTIISGLNQKVSCQENQEVLAHLDQALEWLARRTADRKNRGVEGTCTL